MADTFSNDLASPQLRGAIFSRESKGKGSSIEDQDRENREAADELGAEVVVMLRDKVSASRFGKKAREGWPEIIDWVKSGRLDLLIVWEVSRGDRTMDTWVPFVSACRDVGVLIHVTSAETTYDPRRAAHRKALLDAGSDAEHESEKISARTRKGVAGAAAKGKGHGPVSYGFTRIYNSLDRREFTQVANDDAPIAAAVIERIARRTPLVQIEKELNDAEVPSPGGGRWTRRGIRALAINPAAAGLRGHNGTLHKANWKGIVPESTWRTAVAVLNEPDRKSNAPGAYRWLLSYVAVSACGNYVRATPRKPPRRDLYRCACGCVGVGIWELDWYVKELVFARLSREDAREVFAPDDTVAAEARDKVKRVKRELAELEESARKGPEEGGVSIAFAASVEPGIRKRLADAEAELKRHAGNAALLALVDADDIAVEWERLSVAARRSVVADLFERIEVGPTTERLTRHTTDADRVRIAVDRTKIEWA